ncbi:MAG TPA: hypothetical protein VIN05_13460 [Roseovarius sp.]
MCSACGNPAAPGHWAEAGAQRGGSRLRAVFHRVSILQHVLKPYGFTAHTNGMIPQIQLTGPGGIKVMVKDLTELWAEVERIQGYPIDPLTPHGRPLP